MIAHGRGDEARRAESDAHMRCLFSICGSPYTKVVWNNGSPGDTLIHTSMYLSHKSLTSTSTLPCQKRARPPLRPLQSTPTKPFKPKRFRRSFIRSQL